jgi:glutamate carboxypeptidase
MPAALALLKQMVDINSWTNHRDGVNRLGRFTAECFAPLGFRAEFVPSRNAAWGDHLVLFRPGQSPSSIAMISHLDTVFPPEEEARNDFHWRAEGDRIYGPGTHDIKGGTVMMWLVLRALQAVAPAAWEATTWRLFWNSAEEMLSPDFGDLCRARFDAGTRAALVFESEGRLGTEHLLVAARKGRATWRMTVHGRGAHAGARHRQGANAIVQLGRTLERAAALTDYGRDLTVNVGSVRGGQGLNRVPHEAVAEGELRAFTPAAYAHGKAALLNLAGPGEVRSPADGFACQVNVEILSETRPWPRNAATDGLLAVWQAAGAELGMAVGPEERGGLSDGNLIWDAVPTLDGLGPWGDHDHCSERTADGSKVPEYVDRTSFVPKAALNTRALLKLLGSGVRLVLMLLAVAGSVAVPAADPPAAVYAKDVEFLLTELEQRAGHFFPVKQVDWPAVSRQFRTEVQQVATDADHVRLCGRLVARLRDGHAGLRDLKVALPDEARGRRWTGPRLHLVVVGEEVYVRQAWGEAAARGVRVGQQVTRIEDLAARTWLTRRVEQLRDEQGYSTDPQALYAACHWGLADWEGTRITFELASETGTPTVVLTRRGGSNFVPLGPVFPPSGSKQIGRQSYGTTPDGFGYVHLRDVPGNLPEQLDTMLEALGDLPGLILDLRANGGGGCDHGAVFGRFIPAGQTWRHYRSAGRRPCAAPMVVIIDAGTRSAGETVAAMLKEDGRAYLIGDGPTAGTSSQKTTLAVPSGLFSVYFSVASNMRRCNGGRGIEGLGVAPHETVAYVPAEFAQGVDTLIHRAQRLLREGLPAATVPFAAGRSP